jgi:CHAD domain-containing protein
MSLITSTTPLWIAARQLLAAHGTVFFRHWSKVAKSFQVEDIHDLRVASRRLREAIALFEPCFPEKGLTPSGKKVKQVTEILGELRNTDESILFFSQLSPEERHQSELALHELLQHLEKERGTAEKSLKSELKKLKPGALKSTLLAALDAPLLFANERTDPFQPLGDFARDAIAARALPLAERQPHARDEANAAAQHQMRIAVKHLRYRLEILEPLFAAGFAELQRDLKEYQEVLGKLHDLDVFAQTVLERVSPGIGQQNLLRVITTRRSRLFATLVKMFNSRPADALGARARSNL